VLRKIPPRFEVQPIQTNHPLNLCIDR
jgi:hypothetical protein